MRIYTTVSDKTILSEERVVDIIKVAAVRFFPKICSCCGRRFNSMKEYLESTAHLSQPRSYDADMQDWQPKKP